MKHLNKVSALDASGLGLAEGGTIGFSSELWAGLQAAQEATVSGDWSQFQRRYTTLRDMKEQELKQAEQDQPLAYGAAELGGSFVAPGGVLAKTANTMGNVIKVGAATEGLRGLGKSEADLTQGEFGQAALDVVEGGAAGAAGGAIAKKGIDTLGKIGTNLKTKYADDALRYIEETGDYPSLNTIKQAAGKELRGERVRNVRNPADDIIPETNLTIKRLEQEKLRLDSTLKQEREMLGKQTPEGIKMLDDMVVARKEFDNSVDEIEKVFAIQPSENMDMYNIRKMRDGVLETNRAANAALKRSKNKYNEYVERSDELSRGGYSAASARSKDIESELTSLDRAKRTGELTASTKRPVTIDELERLTEQRKRKILSDVKESGGVLPKSTLKALDNRLATIKMVRDKGYIPANAKVYGTVNNKEKIDVGFIRKPFSTVKNTLKTLSVSAANIGAGISIGAAAAGEAGAVGGAIIGILVPKIVRAVVEGRGKVSGAVNNAIKTANDITKKYGPVKLQQMGVYAEHLSGGGTGKYSRMIGVGTETLGITGAGIVHAKLLETDPEYRKWVRSQLKEKDIPMTLLFNEKK